MKRYLLMLFIPFIFILTAKASYYEVKWENYYVDVIIDDDINKYVEIPIAKLYIDGVFVDTDVNYDRSYDYTSIEHISVEVIGEYYVLYEAMFNEYSISSVQEITFNVYDPSYPEFNIPTDVYVEYQGYYDFESIKCTDAIDGELAYEYIGSINYDELGDYEYTFYATDSSGNSTEYEVIFHVIDLIPPEISIIDRYIDVGDEVDLNDYVEYYDNYDEIISNPLFVHNIDFDRVGDYEVKIYLKDTSGNYIIEEELFYVVDRKKPKIILATDKIKIDKNEIINLKDYIVDVVDNYCNLDNDDIKIESNYKSEIGLYEAVYSIEDSYGNVGKNRIVIEVVDNYLLDIQASNKTINLNDKFDPYIDVYAYDDNVDVSHRLNYSGYVDTSKAGVYEVTYNVYDLSGNYIYKTIYVSVIGKGAKYSNISFPKDIVIDEYYDESEDEANIKNDNKTFKLYYLIIPIILVIGFIIFIIIKKRRKKK